MWGEEGETYPRAGGNAIHNFWTLELVAQGRVVKREGGSPQSKGLLD